ncbi:ABC-type protease exporter, membrane fusion protein (MFP) family component PrtE/AprE [Grimontia indica]|uniref:Membrane fusion protein (MFP) family protein n=1 Tax=Grimontia indica TaxID=1056512 RepID=R1GMW4_9GAMM|nr:HlyD family type I secretion periplasmic adaptor subunit [Grimontia indica]EOD77483.1 ABC-type protease exporter, membrane fusion protein (MFP) family component PrtE/AprE [Grimontia indica]
MSKNQDREHVDMADDIYGAMMMDVPGKYRVVVWLLIFIVASFIVWASLSSLDQVTRGEGKVIPSSQIQLIQSLDGGILQEMYVKEGMIVEKGMPIVRIDDTRFRSDVAQQEEEDASLNANIIRLQKELASVELQGLDVNWESQILIEPVALDFPEELQSQEPELVQRQTLEYQGHLDDLKNKVEIQSRQVLQKQQEIKELKTKIKTLENSAKLVAREYELTKPLAKKKIVPEVELLKLQRQINDMRGEIAALHQTHPKLKAEQDEAILKRRESVLAFKNENLTQVSELEAKLSRLQQAKVGSQDKVDKAIITSPVNGTIKTIHINTLGGVVRPGEDILEIVPNEDQLLIEAKIQPKDIAFLHSGLPAVVKVTAYDFTRYGGLKGKLEHISADTTQDEKGNSFYLVRVRTDVSNLEDKEGTAMPIIPGMLTSVDIITGKRTVLDYILNPILRARESALRER